MLRKHSQFFASMVWLFDMVIVSASFAAAFFLRFHVLTPPQPANATETWLLLGLVLLVCTAVFRLSGLYQSYRLTTRLEEVFAVFRGVGLALLIVTSASYFLRDARYSRLTLVLFGGLSFVLLASTRTVARKFLAQARRRGMNLRYALVVGDGELGRAVVERLEKRPEYGIKTVGFLAESVRRVGEKIGGHEVLGSYEDLERVMAARQIDQVYIALPLAQHDRMREILAALATSTVDVKVVPDFYEYMTLHGGAEEIDGMPIVALRNGPVHGWDAVAKRAFDLAFGALILLLAAPAMIATALAVKLTSKGPVFYAQERMGLDGRTFKILKFRSMRIDAEQTGAKWATAGDNRTTAIGAFIRKYSLDELPQFLNVLQGDMSLVGPRPERPVFIDQFKTQIPNYNLRHKVKAGITGLAQVEGWRGSTSIEKRIERDIYYIEHWSLWLDFKILVRTAFGGFLSKNAY